MRGGEAAAGRPRAVAPRFRLPAREIRAGVGCKAAGTSLQMVSACATGANSGARYDWQVVGTSDMRSGILPYDTQRASVGGVLIPKPRRFYAIIVVVILSKRVPV